MKANKHSQSIPAATLELAKTKIEEVAELLKPYLIALTPDEKHEIPKMGPKTLNFVEKSHEYAHENPSLVPNYLQMDEFDIDFADAHGLWRGARHPNDRRQRSLSSRPRILQLRKSSRLAGHTRSQSRI
ncbi:MAG: hypothetical protein LBC64_04635 [Fibromonadaceae bacterium]|nr:hypothetical protein [Fibromonadaceae bacterium]